jgi:hypothetical protein
MRAPDVLALLIFGRAFFHRLLLWRLHSEDRPFGMGSREGRGYSSGVGGTCF